MIDTENLFKSPEDIERMTAPYMTEDSLFGYTSHFSYKNFLDTEKVAACREQITQTNGLIVLCGHGAAEVYPHPDLLMYVDMARWEIQQRFRRKEVNGLGVNDKEVAPSLQTRLFYRLDSMR